MATNQIPTEPKLTAADAVLSAVGATLLIVTEFVGAILAFGWAVSGLLGLGATATYVVMAVLAVPSLWASYKLTVRILKVEARLRSM